MEWHQDLVFLVCLRCVWLETWAKCFRVTYSNVLVMFDHLCVFQDCESEKKCIRVSIRWGKMQTRQQYLRDSIKTHKIGEAILSILKSCRFESLQFVTYGCKSALATVDGHTIHIKVWIMSKTRYWYCPRNDCRDVTAACGSVVCFSK